MRREHEVHQAREATLGHVGGTVRTHQCGNVTASAQIILGRCVDMAISGTSDTHVDFGAATTTVPAGRLQNLFDRRRRKTGQVDIPHPAITAPLSDTSREVWGVPTQFPVRPRR